MIQANVAALRADKVVRVRAVLGRPPEDRWSAETIKEIKAVPGARGPINKGDGEAISGADFIDVCAVWGSILDPLQGAGGTFLFGGHLFAAGVGIWKR